MKRLLTALALIPAITYVVLWANYWVFLSVLMAVALLCYYEYAGIAEGLRVRIASTPWATARVCCCWRGRARPGLW